MSTEKDENDDIEIISTHDEKIKLIGEIFSNDSSRKILNLLNDDNEMTINEISHNTELSLALVTHHIKRMQSAQLVKISKVGKSIKGHKMNYYTATNQSLLIVPSKTPIPTIKNSLKKFSKFFAIGFAGIVSWVTLNPNTQNSVDFQFSEKLSPGTPDVSLSVDEWSSASESQVDSDANLKIIENQSQEITKPELTHTSGLESESEAEFTSSEVEYFDYRDASGELIELGDSAGVRANTGSVSLDRTVYPQPFDATSMDAVDPVVFSILIPIVVVVTGIILERLLSRWWNKRKQKLEEK